jgi:UDP-N-acetyl-D-glucosamine dehydrogenase
MIDVVIVGLGYVGPHLALAATEAGLSISHIDDVSDPALREALAKGFEAFTTWTPIDDADVVVTCVPTPLAAEGGPDLRGRRRCQGDRSAQTS